MAKLTVITTARPLANRLTEILRGDPCTLFAGAGVLAFAGLRTWVDYLTSLAGVLSEYEPDLATVMRKRISRNQLPEAAHLYFESTDMPIGVKRDNLVRCLKTENYDFKRLVPLVSLPFEAIVTTNYDRALHDAWSRYHRTAPVAVERNDATFKTAGFTSGSFIARIHGREEVPEEMVLESAHYADLEKDDSYQDFLYNLFRRRNCLFVGFSFLDPAIHSVLDLIATKGVFDKLHHAIVPAQADDLIAKLAKANIETILYDAKEHHAVLWEAVQLTADGNIESSEGYRGVRLSAFETARRLLAVCYTRANLGKDVIALKTLVVQGIVISLVAAGETATQRIAQRLREFLPLSDAEADVLTEDAIADLQAKQICSRDADRVRLEVPVPEAGKTQPIAQLREGVLNRLMVRDHYEPKREVVIGLDSVLEEVIVLRGWDLGAEFAGARTEEIIDAQPTIEKAVERHMTHLALDRKRQISESIGDVIRRPAPKEERALGELGRIAFGIEVILQSGRSTMNAAAFPNTVYLDASVLMPAVTPGHPYREAYWNAIKTVQERVGSTSEIYVADVFLEEIYLHRANSIKIFEELRLDKLENLKAFISYFGPANTNVFIGAYSTHVANAKSPLPFSEFLGTEAPYCNEGQLISHLEGVGIRTAWTKSRSAHETKRYADIREALLEAYEVIEGDVDPARRKKSVLSQHEANQLALLEQAIEAGRRPVFVTADAKLRRAVRASSRLRPLLDSLISHLGLIQLVDLLVGLRVDPGSLRRLLWTVQVADSATMIKDYLLGRALEQYDTALVFRMGDLLDEFSTKYAREAELEAIRMSSIHAEQQAKTQRFLDRVQDEMFAFMAEEMKKIKGQAKK